MWKKLPQLCTVMICGGYNTHWANWAPDKRQRASSGLWEANSLECGSWTDWTSSGTAWNDFPQDGLFVLCFIGINFQNSALKHCLLKTSGSLPVPLICCMMCQMGPHIHWYPVPLGMPGISATHRDPAQDPWGRHTFLEQWREISLLSPVAVLLSTHLHITRALSQLLCQDKTVFGWWKEEMENLVPSWLELKQVVKACFSQASKPTWWFHLSSCSPLCDGSPFFPPASRLPHSSYKPVPNCPLVSSGLVSESGSEWRCYSWHNVSRRDMAGSKEGIGKGTDASVLFQQQWAVKLAQIALWNPTSEKCLD